MYELSLKSIFYKVSPYSHIVLHVFKLQKSKC